MVRTLNLKLLLQSPVLNSSSSRTRTRVPGTTANASSGNPCREPSAGCVGAVAGPGVGALPPIVSRDTTGGLSSSGCWACAFALMPVTPIAMPIKNSFPSAFIGPFLLPVTQRESTPAAVGYFLQPLTDRKSTRLNSSHLVISYAVFCLKKKNHIVTDWTPLCPKDRLLFKPCHDAPVLRSALVHARIAPLSHSHRPSL